MKKKITIVCALSLLLMRFSTVFAQHAIGLGVGNHNAPYSAFVNPANAYPDKDRVYINFWGAQMGFTNNFLNYQAPFGLVRMANGNWPDANSNPDGSLNFDQNWITLDSRERNKLYYLNKVYGPSAFFRVDRNVAIGFGVNGVSGLSVDGLGTQAAFLARYGFDTARFSGAAAPMLNQKYSNGAFSINADKYQEWYFSLAGITSKKGPNVWKWGGTGKILLGMGGAGLRAQNADFTVTSGNNLAFTASNASFYHTDDESALGAISHPLGLKFGLPQGAGLGVDAGFMYEHRPENQKPSVLRNFWGCPDDEKTAYDFKFGASLTDIGFLAYSGVKNTINTSTVKNWNINTSVLGNRQIQPNPFSSADENFFQDSGVQAGVNDRYLVSTPAALNVQMDFAVARNAYVALNWQQNLKSAASNGLKNTSYLSVIPRFENEHAEIGLPLTISNDYSQFNVGLYGRLGPVIVGTDNLFGLANYAAGNTTKSANLYFGVRLQLPACGYYEYHHLTQDTVIADTTMTFSNDSFWKVDTLYRETLVHDTIQIHHTDTVIEYRTTTTDAEWQKKQDEILRKQEELRKKEEELNAKAKELQAKEKITVQSDDCASKIKDLEDQLKQERDLYAKLNTQYQDCKDERERIRINMNNLQREIDLLRNENSSLKADVTNRDNEIIRLQNEIKRLKAGNNPCGAQVKTLDSLLAIEQGKNTQLENDKTRKDAEISGLKYDNDGLKNRIAALEKEIELLKAGSGSKDECEKKQKELQALLDAEKVRSSGLERDLADLKNKYQLEQDKTRKLEDQLKNCGSTDEAARLKAELDAQKKKNDELDVQIRTLEAENSGLKSDKSAQDVKVSGLQKELDDLRKEYQFEIDKNKKLEEQLKNCGSTDEAARLKAELDAQKKKCDELDLKIKSLEAENSKLTADNSALTVKVAALDKELADTKGKLDVANAKIADLQDQLKKCSESGNTDELKAQIEDLKKQNSEKDATITGLKKDKAGLESDLATAKAKISDLEKQLSECSGKDCSDCEEKLAQAKSDYNAQVNKYNALYEEYQAMNDERTKLKAKIADLENQLKNCSGSSDENSKLQAEIDKLKITITELNGEVDSKQKSLDDLQEQYDKVVGEKSALQKQITGLQGQIKTLQQQVTDLQDQLKKCQEGVAPGSGEGG